MMRTDYVAGLLLILLGATTCHAAEPPAKVEAVLRWQFNQIQDPSRETTLRSLAKRYTGDNWQPITGAPVSCGKYVVVRNPDRTVAINFKTGVRIFEHPWFMPRNITKPLQDQLEARTWHDTALSRLNVGGSLIVLNTGGPYPGPSEVSRTGLLPQVDWENVLLSLDSAREGQARWAMGTASEFGHEDKQNRLYFLGGVAANAGKFYVLAESKGMIRLQCCKLETATRLWAADLKDTGKRNVSISYHRRIAGATPVIVKDTAICPLNNGLVACVDLDTKEKIWTAEYKSQFTTAAYPQLRKSIFTGTPYFNKPPAPVTRWFGAAVHVVGDKALLSPADSSSLHCVNIRTGKAIWPAIPKGDRIYVAATHDGKAMLAGRKNMTAIDIATGKPAWDKPLTFGSDIAGIGCTHNGYYYMPLQSKEIAKVNLRTGRIETRIRVEKPVGNLLFRNGSIISQTAFKVARFDLPQE